MAGSPWRPARGNGPTYENAATGERVRIMERPFRRKRTDADTKHIFRRYYRYRMPDGKWRKPVPIPDKQEPNND